MQSSRNNESFSGRAERLDRKLGRLWSRFWAIVIGSAGVALMLWFFSGAEDKSLEGTIFIVIIGGGLLLLARYLWRSKAGIVDILDEPDRPVRRSGKPGS